MKRTSTQIILIYLFVGILWILVSDWIFTIVGYPENPVYQTIKGCGFIVISGIGFLHMLRKYEDRNRRYLKKLKALNRRLEEHAAELTASNSELEQFAYIASHDLQEPLRMVTGFLGQIEKKYAQNLDDKGKEYIHFAVDGAARMRHMIMDLLQYSRLGKRDFSHESFDVSELVHEIITLNKPLIDETKAVIEFADLPTISAGRTLIAQVFQNLILNAVKYRKPDVTPRIAIGYRESGEFWEFWVSDNGIGIKEDQIDHIFTLFRRLHSRDEYSGSGIGLAICKKIVENHSGRIWALSKEGEGSTFYFSIKK
ncbi:ATP-binding protein [Flavobacterium sp.]|uniref:sensor histidine kinase n=1 Tax=Flavobacterium sp. TaxID=239 RepID=UPI0025C53BEA|nr:ATP-binding protein [Flavobacterium sp.]